MTTMRATDPDHLGEGDMDQGPVARRGSQADDHDADILPTGLESSYAGPLLPACFMP